MRKTYSLSQILPLVLVIIGFGYLLNNLGIVSVSPGQVISRYWPLLLVFYGFKILGDNYRKARYYGTGTLIFAIVIILIGINLLLPRIGYARFGISWHILWPILLIIIGFKFIVNTKNKHKHTSFVGELSRGGEAWYVDDTTYSHAIGEIKLDLTNAVIPDKEVFFHISGGVGEVTLYLPSDLALKADCRVNIGEINLLGENASGISRFLAIESPNYDSAERKLNLSISLKVGEITVRRIG